MLDEEQFLRLKKHLPGDLSEMTKNVFMNSAYFRRLKKGDILVDELKNNSKSHIILKGSCVRYIINPSGEERAVTFHTEDFMPILGNTYIKSDHSLVNYKIKVNEETDLIGIDLFVVTKTLLLDESYLLFATQNIFRMVAIQNQIQNHQIGLSKKEFLKWLWLNYPDIFKRFKSQDIASFIGSTPIWYSKLKAELLKGL